MTAVASQGNPEFARHVEDRLIAKDSPTTIVIELARVGGIGGDTVSPETIYRSVYAHAKRGRRRRVAVGRERPE